MNLPSFEPAQVPDHVGGPQQFTVHVDFLAEDQHNAFNLAQAYVEALNVLRLEIGSYPARCPATVTRLSPSRCTAARPAPIRQTYALGAAGTLIRTVGLA